ncbi:MAG: Cobalamin-binding protein precursor [Methanosaeta sp. PtaB.Bin039]|nr:MAG: Cobalamin-binding protein precursor [Methanosaeta sp. PtaB.Bin039]
MKTIAITVLMLMAFSGLSSADQTLMIFGNANMDGTIDQDDVSYLEGIISGKLEKTNLSDADCDGKIDQKDVQQVSAIISGKAESISLIDGSGRTVTVKTPVQSAVPLNMRHACALVVLGGEDQVTGVDETVVERPALFPNLSTRQSVGKVKEPDVEKIISLHPDLVLTFTNSPLPELLESKLPNGTAVVRYDLSRAASVETEMRALGYLLGHQKKAEEYLKWYRETMDMVESRAADIPDGEHVRVFMEREMKSATGPSVRWAYANGTGYTDLCELAGGINIAAGQIAYNGDLETEYVISEDPEVIIGLSYQGGYKDGNRTAMEAYRHQISGVLGFEGTAAVKDGRVHIISGDFSIGPQLPLGAAAVARWLYPDLFEDLNTAELHRRFLTDFMGVSFDPEKDGVFCYPAEGC